MTEPEDPSRERLKHHFAQRVIHQARQILEIWQRLQQQWSTNDLPELSEANCACCVLPSASSSRNTQLAISASRWKRWTPIADA
jgi:hypothetical protein